MGVLATEASSRRRTWAGLAGFAAIEIAAFVRYTDIVILGCAVVTVIVAWRLPAARLPLRALCWWLASVAVFGAGVAVFDDLAYGGPLTTGYQPGEISFGLGAIGPNLRYMPAHLMQAMPLLVLGLAALAWIIVRQLVLRAGRRPGRRRGPPRSVGRPGHGRVVVRRSGFSTPRTTGRMIPPRDTLQTVRFYVPAIGAISLLGAWLVTRIPGRAMAGRR